MNRKPKEIIDSIKSDGLKSTFILAFKCARCGRFRISGGWYDVCRRCDRELRKENE